MVKNMAEEIKNEEIKEDINKASDTEEAPVFQGGDVEEIGNIKICVDVVSTIVVKYGIKIPELAWEIQESVKNNVETMTGLNVAKVNIHIEGVNFVKDGPENNEAEAEDEED